MGIWNRSSGSDLDPRLQDGHRVVENNARGVRCSCETRRRGLRIPWGFDHLAMEQRRAAIMDETLRALNAVNFGIGSDGIQHILWRVGHGELDGIKPKVVVLMAGINNTNTYD